MITNAIREQLDNLKKIVHITLQMVVACLIGLEVAIPPNPYKNQLIFSLVVLICLKHDIPKKILKKLDK